MIDSEREELLRVSLGELDGPADPEVDMAWLVQVQRRSPELEAGQMGGFPAAEVLANIDAAHRQ